MPFVFRVTSTSILDIRALRRQFVCLSLPKSVLLVVIEQQFYL